MKKIYTALFCAFCITNAYADTCPSTYPNNLPGTSICYLITGPGEYVPTPGAGVAPCPADNYCPGGDKIYDIKIPEQYKPVEYLENNSTAYIDTGHIPTSATTVNADVLITGGCNSSTDWLWRPFIGTQVDTDHRYMVGIYKNETGGIDFDYFTDVKGCSDLEHNYINERVNFKTQIQNNTIYVLANDTELCARTVLPAPAFKHGIALFTGADDNLHRHAYGRFYFYQAYESDELVQNMIPVYDTVSEQYGMYDTVNDKFFTSANDDKFTGGPILENIGGNYSCAGATENEFISSPPKSTDVTDCGKILHLGNHKLYLRRRQITHPALAVQWRDTVLYAEMSTEKRGHLRTILNGVVYSIFNMNAD